MQKYSKLLIILVVLPLVLTSCMGGKDKGKGSFPGAGQKVEKPIIVMVQDMQLSNLDKYIRVTGKLEGINDVDLSSEVSGKVVEIHKNLGDWVNKGETIGRIDNSDYENQMKQANAQLMAAEAALEMAELSLTASTKLFEQDKISQNEFLQAKSSQKNSQASYNGALANAESMKKKYDNSQFTAPVSGYIAELNLEVGEMVTQGKIIAGIVNTKQVMIKSGISESDIPYVKKGDPVTVSVKGKEVKGKVSGVGIRPSTGSNNYPVEIVINNSEKMLYPGMVVESHIFSQTFENVLYTSIENLREKYDNNFVYVINSENRAEIRIVSLGEKVANNIIITSGLEIGDRMVIDGIDSLNEGSLVDARSGFNSK